MKEGRERCTVSDFGYKDWLIAGRYSVGRQVVVNAGVPGGVLLTVAQARELGAFLVSLADTLDMEKCMEEKA
jgi:hypothetical protein